VKKEPTSSFSSNWLVISSLILSVVAVSLAGWVLFKSERLVYVDSARLVNGYKGMETARAEYQKRTATWRSNVDTLIVEIQRELTRFEKENGKMTAKEKDLTKKLIQTKQQQLADYQRAVKEKAAQEDSQLTKKVLDEINAYLKEYGKSHHYKIILAATDYGNIAYAEEGMDITNEVLEGLNKKFSGK
jgi:outer membrane protein